MEMSDAKKLEILWKILMGKTSSSDSKEYFNETYSSYSPVLPTSVWKQAGSIPVPQPITAADATSTWASIISVVLPSSPVSCAIDETVSEKNVYGAVANQGGTVLSKSNRITDWVPPSVDNSYSVRVFTKNTAGSYIEIYPFADNNEFYFDYASGILTFINETPDLTNGLFLSGSHYIGSKGVVQSSGDVVPLSQMQIKAYTGNQLTPGNIIKFMLPTGSNFYLTSLTANVPCTIECHSTSAYNDTNPYRFRAILGHLTDDGTFIAGGDTYFGHRNILLQNSEDQSSNNSYWLINNDQNQTNTVYLNISILSFNSVSSATVTINDDGTTTVSAITPDVVDTTPSTTGTDTTGQGTSGS